MPTLICTSSGLTKGDCWYGQVGLMIVWFSEKKEDIENEQQLMMMKIKCKEQVSMKEFVRCIATMSRKKVNARHKFIQLVCIQDVKDKDNIPECWATSVLAKLGMMLTKGDGKAVQVNWFTT